jgi:hypothetical protein
MLSAILFPFLKIYDLIKRLSLKKEKTRVTFKHPNHAHLMKEVYTAKKNNPDGSFYVMAHPESNNWDEYIKLGGIWLHNYYHLDVTKERWHGTPTWRTFTTAVIAAFELDFSSPDQTVLSVVGDQNITDSTSFQSWFKYCKKEGVEDIVVEKS